MLKNTREKVNEIQDVTLNELEKECGMKLHYHYHGNVKTLHDMTIDEIPKERARIKRLERLGVY